MGGPAVSAEDVPRISVEELKALMDSGADITILDNRPRESYEMGHIKGAVSLPWSPAGLTEDDTALLRYGKLTVTYCDCGPGEADSADVALQLIQVYQMEDVKVLADPSIYGWIEAGYPTEP
jgi:rhodanese-related sulfurtransferase